MVFLFSSFSKTNLLCDIRCTHSHKLILEAIFSTVPPKSLIPVGSEVTIIDFPIRELNGAKGVVKAFDDSSCRYKVEVNDAKKGPQEFLMPKDKLRIDTLTLPVRRYSFFL